MMQPQARRSSTTTRSNRTLIAVLLAVIVIGPAHFPSTAAPAPVGAVTHSGVHGPQPFATILCKFADVAAEPDPVAYFEQLLGSAYPGLDHYWREASYGAISLAGSKVMGWFELPQPQASYLIGAPNSPLPTATSPVDLQRLTEDCVAAAGAAFASTRYIGINLVLNANLDRPRGTEICLELAGESKCYRTTWFWPDWYRHHSIWAHETGHAFGLQHSAVGNGNSYGNMWDVMSVDGPCRTESGYGRIGQHPNAFQKDALGWIPAERIFTTERAGQTTITLAQTAMPEADGYLLARVPIRTGEDTLRRYYTVEARRRIGYDASLPGDGVIIHEVHLDGDPQVRLVSTVRGGRAATGVTTGLAARWLPGQLFRDAQHEIAVTVDRATPAGFVVTIFTGPLPTALLTAIGALPQTQAAAVLPFPAQPDRGESKPTILADRSGVYAIWMASQAESGEDWMPTGSPSADIHFAYRPAGGGWEAEVKINDDSRDARAQPALAVDRQGTVYAAWVDYRDGSAAVYAASRPAGGVWSKNIRLSGGSPNGYVSPTIIIDWENNTHVLWEGLDRCGGGEVVLKRNATINEYRIE